jgi:protein-L-isoaspartate(D-aspartate) O-methyltransferase
MRYGRLAWLRSGLALSLMSLAAACSASPTAQATHPTNASTPNTEPDSACADPFAAARIRLVQSGVEGLGVSDPDVLRAMRTVPRHEFVPSEFLDQAYDNHPLPIGYGQTISQPYIVGWMTEMLELAPGEKVLEIGTGSGYQAAVLAELAELGNLDVYSIEIVPELAAAAARRLKDLGYGEVHTKQGDGYYGWPEFAPFDAIIVTAAPDHVPAPLVAQLAEGGRLVIPIGPPGGYQSLWQFVQTDGELTAYNLGGVAFVPLIGSGIEAQTGEPASPP